jgi:gmma-aminobutyric acid receptor subunit gamma/cGMP-dependent protein kinase 2
VTSTFAKIAEKCVNQFFNDHFFSLQDDNQFGSTVGRSTTLALLKLSHYLFTASDCSDNFIRVLFIDFTKAFDLVSHNILLDKYEQYDFPPHVTIWSLDFLRNRLQYVSVGDGLSSCAFSNAGTPQGTLSGPNNFKLLINDLCFQLQYAKYVDDTTVFSVSQQATDSALQEAADYLASWSISNGMRLNIRKTKEMVIHFGLKSSVSDVPMLELQEQHIERVDTFKLLGVIFNSKLTWDDHVAYIVGKASKRIFSIRQLMRAGVKTCDVIVVYCSVVRSVLEYACEVWHPGLTNAQSDVLEAVQRRCLRIIFPQLSYRESLESSKLEKLSVRRERVVIELFSKVKCPSHPLHCLLTRRTELAGKELRAQYPFKIEVGRTSRIARSFINYCIQKRF